MRLLAGITSGVMLVACLVTIGCTSFDQAYYDLAKVERQGPRPDYIYRPNEDRLAWTFEAEVWAAEQTWSVLVPADPNDAVAGMEDGESARPDLSGRWTGVWRKDDDGQRDLVRCIISDPIRDDNMWDCRFFGTYFGPLGVEYLLELEAFYIDDAYHFAGTAVLRGRANAIYHYKGMADGEHFYITFYTNTDEYGIIAMRRPTS